MPWWVWMVVGAILLAGEMLFIDAQFYLIFIGVAALVVGLFGLSGVALPEWLQWMVFATVALGSMVLFRQKLYDKLRQPSEHLHAGPQGEEVTVTADLAPGASCRLEFRGSTWTAHNAGEHAILAGSQARIVRVDGLTLQIRSAKH